MKARPAIAIFSILATVCAFAQNVKQEPQSDPVLDAIQEFNNRDKGKPNEVTVVLDDAAPEAAVVKDLPVAKVADSEPAVLVTGKPPEGTDVVVPPEQPAVNATATDLDEETPAPENGLAVRVERLQTGKGTIDPSKVKLLAPFPAKPLAAAPVGWHLDSSATAPPFTREVEISPGSKITLTIRPHLLVPDADGSQVFSISEPGYDNTLGYQQTATVGAILSNSIRQLDEDSKQLGSAIDRLQQLLVSLPKPEVQPEIKPATVRKK
ncbi:MAG: hypothetical protein ABIS50_02215 [Luteolibacter sp.]|uniref:hypothetical protein n=1 Tax=Luteolibacter sp. TaxID=1962973 RepID=UPI0032675244